MKKENIISFLFGLIISAIIFISIHFLLIGKTNRYDGAMLEKGSAYIIDKKTGEMKIFYILSDKPIKSLKYSDEIKSKNEKNIEDDK